MNSLKILAEDDLLLETIAVLVVEILHFVVDMESQIDVMSKDVFALGYVHGS